MPRDVPVLVEISNAPRSPGPHLVESSRKSSYFNVPRGKNVGVSSYKTHILHAAGSLYTYIGASKHPMTHAPL
eukprot:4344916-Prymnesium_polylepis.2